MLACQTGREMVQCAHELLHEGANVLKNQVALTVAAEIPAFVDLVCERIALELPHFFDTAEGVALANASTKDLLHEFAQGLEHGERTFHAPPAALGFARHLARRGVRLADVLRSYRLGHELLFERCVALAVAEPRGQASVDQLGLLMLRFTDDVSREVADAFDEERESFLRGAIARRESMITALLAGAQFPPSELEQTLGRRMPGTHLALVAWRDDGSPDTQAISEAIASLNETLFRDRPLVIANAAGHVYAWGTPRDSARHREDLPTGVDEALELHGVRVAIGAPAAGVKGFVGSRRQADTARVVAAMRPGPRICWYADVALLALLLRDHTAARAFALEELNGLAKAGRAGEVLRETVLVYLESHLDASKTARRLQIHRNTVARRLSHAEELLGHPLHHRSMETYAALLIEAADQNSLRINF